MNEKDILHSATNNMYICIYGKVIPKKSTLLVYSIRLNKMKENEMRDKPEARVLSYKAMKMPQSKRNKQYRTTCKCMFRHFLHLEVKKIANIVQRFN